MRVQHNIMAMNAYRNYTNNTKALAKNLERLSSGYRINSAADDAAGLAISEKMRAQITGLDAAQKNVKDSQSLVKTAEGAMQEIQDMLNRMNYLATQSSNGTYDNEVDRANLQKEVVALKTEIDRIAESANFNGLQLLDGSMTEKAASNILTDVKGIDRMLQDVIGNGEKPNEVVGEKTILDKGTTSNAVKTKVTFDFNGLGGTIVGGAKGDTTTQPNLVLDIKIGNETKRVTINGAKGTAGAAGADTTVTGQMVAKALENVLKGSGDGGVTAGAATTCTIDGIDYTIGTAANGKLELTMVNDPVTEEETTANLDIKVLKSDTSSATSVLSGSQTAGVQVTAGKVAGTAQRANTIFRIDASDIRDGAKITIGDKTVILKVGAASNTVKGAANALVDLSDMEEGAVNMDVVLSRISEGFGTAAITDANAKDATGAAVTVGLTVGVSDTSQGYPYGLTVQRTDTGTAADDAKAVYNSKDKLAAIFKMEYTVHNEATKALSMQIGDTSADYNQMKLSIRDMHVDSLGIADIDISTQEGAQAAIDVIKNAINLVSETRGDLGAVSNRLDHTANNLSTMAENLQDAESTIRDTDIAEEMMAYTKNSILVQSAQAMLAQANQIPQGVLQLLG